jgi:hypothetical protein
MLRPSGILAFSLCANLLLAAPASISASSVQFDFRAVVDQQSQEINATPSTDFSAANFPYEDLAKSLGIPNDSDRPEAALLAVYFPTLLDSIVPATDTSTLSLSAFTNDPSAQSFTNISQVAPFPASPGNN